MSKRLATVGRKNSLLRPPVEPGVSENTQTLWEGRQGVVAPTGAHKQTGAENKCSLCFGSPPPAWLSFIYDLYQKKEGFNLKTSACLSSESKLEGGTAVKRPNS